MVRAPATPASRRSSTACPSSARTRRASSCSTSNRSSSYADRRARSSAGTLWAGLVNVTSRRPGLGKWTGQMSVPVRQLLLVGHSRQRVRAPHRRHVERQRSVQLRASARALRSTTSPATTSTRAERSAARASCCGSRRPSGRRASSSAASARATATTPSTISRRCAKTRSTRRATTRATPTATSSARPFRRNAPGDSMRLSSTTGFVKWKTEDSTDLDYSPLPLIIRDNAEEDFQFTQEVRLASAAPKKLSDTAALKWQTGVFLFTQSYQQDAVNMFAPACYRRSSPCRSTSIRRCPNWTTSASACSVRAR